MVYWMDKQYWNTGDGGRALHKPMFSTRTSQDLGRLGPGKKPTSPLSFFTMISLSRPQTHRKQLTSALYLFPHKLRKTYNLNHVYLWQPNHSENQAVDLCSSCSELPATFCPFPMVTETNRDSSDNTRSDHGSLLCSNTFFYQPARS